MIEAAIGEEAGFLRSGSHRLRPLEGLERGEAGLVDVAMGADVEVAVTFVLEA